MTRTILVVDDEEDLAVTCQRLLNRRGWHVTIVGNREAALATLARTPPPVLAIDMPVIVVTGQASRAMRRLVLEEGAAGFLGKPFSAHDLLELVRVIVGDADGAAPPT
jgi:DNA-binding response OmpR family regulator